MTNKPISAMTMDDIDDLTAFAQGDKFTSEEQVREYFTTENMHAMGIECTLTQDELDEMADRVLDEGWHMARECDICSHAGLYTAATTQRGDKHLCDSCAAEVDEPYRVVRGDYRYEFWLHHTSGETWAVLLDDKTGEIVGTCGPLYYDDVRFSNLPNFDYDYSVDDIAWIDAHYDEFRLVEKEYQ